MCVWGRGRRSNYLGSYGSMRFLFMAISRRFLAHHPWALVILPRSDSPLSSWSWPWHISGADYRPSPPPRVRYRVKFDGKNKITDKTGYITQRSGKTVHQRIPFPFLLPEPSSPPQLKEKVHLGLLLQNAVCWRHNRPGANTRITTSFFFPNTGFTTSVQLRGNHLFTIKF